jgi:hypothetical protein
MKNLLLLKKQNSNIILQIPKKLQLAEYLVKDNPDLLK